jgi:hypothetical protein
MMVNGRFVVTQRIAIATADASVRTYSNNSRQLRRYKTERGIHLSGSCALSTHPTLCAGHIEFYSPKQIINDTLRPSLILLYDQPTPNQSILINMVQTPTVIITAVALGAASTMAAPTNLEA